MHKSLKGFGPFLVKPKEEQDKATTVGHSAAITHHHERKERIFVEPQRITAP